MRETRQVKVGAGIFAAIAVIAVVAIAGAWLAEAWLADIVYSSILEGPDSGAPAISFWQMFGVVGVLNFILGGALK